MFLFIRAKGGTSKEVDSLPQEYDKKFVFPIFDVSMHWSDVCDLLAAQIERLIPYFNFNERSVVIENIAIQQGVHSYNMLLYGDEFTEILNVLSKSSSTCLEVSFIITHKQLRQTQEIIILPQGTAHSKYFAQNAELFPTE